MALISGQSLVLPSCCACGAGSSTSGSRRDTWPHLSSHKWLGGVSTHNSALRAEGSWPRRKGNRRGGGRLPGGAGTARAYDRKPVNPVDDPFNFGEDEDMEDGELMSVGKQSVEVPKPPASTTNEYGFLDFPQYYNVEIASLGVYIRDDVRRCLCYVAGGVYENLLFFPAIQLIKNRYPGAQIDVVAGERGKQAYEMNKYVNKAHIFDTDAEWTPPADLMEFLGVMRGEYFDLILSTKYAGFKHCSTLFMIGGRTRRVSYVPKYHSEWVSNKFLAEAIEAPREILAEGGYNMYAEIMDYVAQPGKGVPQEPIPPLQIGISKRVAGVVREKMNDAGLLEGRFLVFHGIESTSEASMTSLGDKDSLLPLPVCAELLKKVQDSSGLKVVVVVPHRREIQNVVEACGEDTPVIYITTPGQLGALIRDSAGVVSTNTAAMLLAAALKKPCVALFGSTEKASLFVPPQSEKINAVASKTGKLVDVDVDEAVTAWKRVYEGQLALAA